MTYKSCFSFLLLVFAVLWLGAGEAHACSCGPSPTTLEAYEEAGFVVITRVVSVERMEPEKATAPGRVSDGENYANGVKSTRMIIERVFKGNLKAGDEMTFGQGGGGDCIWTFSEELIGQSFLFYLRPREKNPAIWYGFGCGRSRSLKYANDDLLYLNNLERVRDKSRLSGTVVFDGDGSEPGVEGRRIRITATEGASKSYEVKIDKNGVYEIYDLPAGQYLIEPEVPAGWKVGDYALRRSKNIVGDRKDRGSKKIIILVEAKKHAALDIVFEIDNALRGKVYDPGGKLMSGVCLNLIPAQDKTQKHFYMGDCTEEAGTFEITEIPPGNYLLVVNKEGKISSSEPFKTFYYPDVSERERATVINIGAGDMLEGFDVRAPHAEAVVTVEGVLLYSDGKPAADETVEFTTGKKKDSTGDTLQDTDEDTGMDAIEDEVQAKTDAKGRFSMRILKGLEGELYGRMITYEGEFAECPKLEAILKKVDSAIVIIKTDAVKIRATGDLKQVEVRFSFPACKKAKLPEDAK